MQLKAICPKRTNVYVPLTNKTVFCRIVDHKRTDGNHYSPEKNLKQNA